MNKSASARKATADSAHHYVDYQPKARNESTKPTHAEEQAMTHPNPEWQKRIDAAQRLTHYTVFKVPFLRIAYGHDHPFRVKPYCRDCGVAEEQLHVPGCCVERCPACLGQEIGCGCRDDLPSEEIPE
ncbi:MAG: hypothetical protein EOP77_00150 [Variovorax sp.]|nr:MAG: hypothetical protein EOP77_00150 [Variovorax sp.]